MFLMASTSSALTLSDGGGRLLITYDPEPNIQEDHGGDYTEGKMDNESSPYSFFVVYDKINYGKSEGAQSTLIPPDPNSGSSQTVKFNFTAQSAHGFDVRRPGIVLFHHPNYVGNGKDYRSSHMDVSESFPGNGNSPGATSFIVTGGTWRLYGSIDHQPPIITVGNENLFEEGIYPSTEGKKVMSIERVIHT